MFVWMDLHFPQARFGSGWRFALSSASVLYLVSYTDMICTTSGGVSRRRHELIESCSRPPTLVDCSELKYAADVLTWAVSISLAVTLNWNIALITATSWLRNPSSAHRIYQGQHELDHYEVRLKTQRETASNF